MTIIMILLALNGAYHSPACFDFSTQEPVQIHSTHCEFN